MPAMLSFGILNAVMEASILAQMALLEQDSCIVLGADTLRLARR